MNNETLNNDINNEEKREFLLSQDKFELLMNIQKEIEEKTEMRPTFKKMINMLVNEESLDKVKTKIIENCN